MHYKLCSRIRKALNTKGVNYIEHRYDIIGLTFKIRNNFIEIYDDVVIYNNIQTTFDKIMDDIYKGVIRWEKYKILDSNTAGNYS